MTYDIVPFLNEIEVLKIRMRELARAVDCFIVVESPVTFSGHAKPLNFEFHRSEFAEWQHKISYRVVDDMPSGSDPWVRERHMRDSMKAMIHPADEDVVIYGDVDEVPRASAVEHFAFFRSRGIAGLSMPHLYYYLNLQASQVWCKSKIMAGAQWNIDTPTSIRDGNPDFILPNAGWHFSYMGGVPSVLYKIQSFSHCNDANIPQLVNDYTSGIQPAERNAAEYGLHKVPIDETYPQCIRDNVEWYQSMGMILQ